MYLLTDFLSTSSTKLKTFTPNKFHTFQETELSSSKIKKFVLFVIKKPLWRNLLFFRKWNFLAPSLKNCSFKEELRIPQNPKFILLQKKLWINFFPKTLLDDSFPLLHKLNQTILTAYKNSEIFLLHWIFFKLLDIFYYI